MHEDLRPVRAAAVGAPAGATRSTAVRGPRQELHGEKVPEIQTCEASVVQEDLRLVRVAAAVAAASQSQLTI